ncbi:MAG: permease [Acidobacteria bacterium]|nr:permease [Acidobacteriota bacterium]
MAIQGVGVLREQSLPAGYKWSLAGCIAFLSVTLLAIVDSRRGFLFTLMPDWGGYPVRTPYLVLNPLQLPMIAIGLAGLLLSYRSLKGYEMELKGVNLEKKAGLLTFILFGLLLADLFTYRGVAATRAAMAGKLGVDWLNAFGVTGWLRPAALAVSYLLTVWHATFLSILLAGLALTTLPATLKPFVARTGFKGSLFGSLFALSQPFCSCCSSAMAPSLVRQGASANFFLAFVVGSPMLNPSTLILAALLLPAPYAISRIVAGIVLTILVTYGVAHLAERRDTVAASTENRALQSRVARWANWYTGAFHLDKWVSGRQGGTPASMLSTWFYVSGRMALLLVPTLLVWSILTAVIVQILPSAFGNNVPSVIFSAAAGTLLMIPTWTEIPVVLQMIQSGFSGPAAALLVVLPSVSLPCLLILGGCIGRWRVVALLGLAVMAAGMVAGVAFL